MSVTRDHWLLLVTLVALGVAAYVAFLLGSGAAEAHYTGGYHWHHEWDTCWRLYYPSGGPSPVIQCWG